MLWRYTRCHSGLIAYMVQILQSLPQAICGDLHRAFIPFLQQWTLSDSEGEGSALVNLFLLVYEFISALFYFIISIKFHSFINSKTNYCCWYVSLVMGKANSAA